MEREEGFEKGQTLIFNNGKFEGEKGAQGEVREREQQLGKERSRARERSSEGVVMEGGSRNEQEELMRG